MNIKELAADIITTTRDEVDYVYSASDGAVFEQEHEAQLHNLLCACIETVRNHRCHIDDLSKLVALCHKLASGELN